ncbi:hypothetical protein UFOVP1202_21 [uncultured Caudovirales phage]|uniref:Uncharacterized protein n=1 Tax=uncultured Caudovirales phage TaxID=2100421 RepID=A0A6J5RBU9_9CAUD|nr:hypothetical protein UFOVP1202_21 [uncultured Caudovirales phage]
MDKGIIGIKDMHQTQIEELMNFIAHALDLSSTLADVLEEEDIFDETKNKVENLLEMFGGHAIITDQTLPESLDLEQG